MKKYKVPDNIKEIIITEGQFPMASIRKLEKQGKDWIVVEKIIILEEIKNA